MTMNDKIKEFIRFGIVGVFATIIHYGIYFLIIKVGGIDEEIWINIVYSIGYVVSFIFNYFLSAKFTFKEPMSLRNGIGFIFSHAFNYVLHLMCLNLFLCIGIPSELAPIPVFAIVVPINFLLVRLVFKKIK